MYRLSEFDDPETIIEHRQLLANNGVRRAMTIDESKQIEELLTAWNAWQATYKPQLGYGRVATSCRGFSESNRFDDIDDRTSEAARREKNRECEQVEVCVDGLSHSHRQAIQQHFGEKAATDANVKCGVAVWRYARAFDFNNGPHIAYREAKFALLPALRHRGMIRAEPAHEKVTVSY